MREREKEREGGVKGGGRVRRNDRRSTRNMRGTGSNAKILSMEVRLLLRASRGSRPLLPEAPCELSVLRPSSCAVGGQPSTFGPLRTVACVSKCAWEGRA